MSTEETLLAAIYADPGDDEARRVYADVLLDRGDPRGELIVVQLRRAAGIATEAEKERERSLLDRHIKEWLGPIAPCLDIGAGKSGAWARARTRFERGFFATAYIARAVPAAVLRDPRWTTVEEMRGSVAHNVALLVHAHLPALRRLRGKTEFRSEHLETLAKRTTSLWIDRLEVAWAGQVLPRIVHVTPGAEVSAILSSPSHVLLDGLATLGLSRARLRVADLVSASESLVGRSAQFERVVLQQFRPPRDELVLDGTSGTYQLLSG